MPFGKYKDFQDCVVKNQDQKNPRGYCAQVHKQITGKWPSEMSDVELSARGLK